MSQESPIPLRLRQLINVVCDQVATDAEIEELDKLLRSDRAALESYLEHCRLHVDLHFVIRARKMAEHAVGAIGKANAVVAPKNPPAELPAGPPAAPVQDVAIGGVPIAGVPIAGVPTKSPVLGFLGGAMDYVNHSRMLMFWLMAVLVSGWFAFQLGSLVLDRSHRGDARVASQSADSKSSDVSHRPGGASGPLASPRQGGPVASITTLVDCHWRVVSPAAPTASAPTPGDVDTAGPLQDDLYRDDLFRVGSELSAGQELDLVRGLAEITFRSGARIVLNGPAHFTIGSPLGGKLQVGKLTARVPHDAHGFTVKSPAGEVVDLGTEFGVAVAANHTMDVEVFVGEVAVDASSADGQTPDSPSQILGSPPPTLPQKLTAGHAVHVEAGKPVATISLDPKRFVRGLGPREDSKVAQAAYLDFVRSLKPVVWFRMEGQDTDRVLHDEMGNAPDGKLHWDGPGNPFVEGRLGKGLWLRGPKLKDYGFVPSYPQAEYNKLSVSAWAYADSRPAWAKIVANWGTGPNGQFSLGLYREGVDLAVHFVQSDGKQGLLREGLSHPFPFNEWQHVAFVTDGSTMRLYRQGREVASIRHAGILYPVGLKSLSIGAYQGKSGEELSKTVPSLWDGKLDEIAIFNDALSADDIRKLAEAPPQ